MQTEVGGELEPTAGLREAEPTPADRYYPNANRPCALGGLSLRADGLVEHRRKVVVTPWDEVYGVIWKDQHAVIQLAGRTLKVDQRFGDWREIGREVEARAVWLQPERAGEEVGPEAIARWLGIPIDGRLSCGNDKLRLIGWGIVALYMLILVGGALGDRSTNAASFTYMLMVGVGCLMSANRITADVEGISLRAGRKPLVYAWDEIESISNSGYSWTVKTTGRQKFQLSTSLKDVQPLVRALQHAAAARKAGAVLPDERPISDVALSRPGAPVAEPGAEKGLSRTGE